MVRAPRIRSVVESGPLAELSECLHSNSALLQLAAGITTAGLPGGWIAAGCVAQTVWNCRHGYAPCSGIVDFDVVYFDSHDLTRAAEQRWAKRLAPIAKDLGVEVDLKNQARVHTWYRKRFGLPIAPFSSVAHAMATWPTFASAVGVRLDPDGTLHVLAPYGLVDLLRLVVRPNKVIVPRQVYETKASRWKALWPKLDVHPW